jgi:predicted RNA binding protein YcfA (HicA-like mRNA interferase family)
MKFSELVRLLERNSFTLVREKGSIRYYTKSGLNKLIRVDYHGAKEVPTGTCNAILNSDPTIVIRNEARVEAVV